MNAMQWATKSWAKKFSGALLALGLGLNLSGCDFSVEFSNFGRFSLKEGEQVFTLYRKQRHVIPKEEPAVTSTVLMFCKGFVKGDLNKIMQALTPETGKAARDYLVAMGDADPGRTIQELYKNFHPAMKRLTGLNCKEGGNLKVSGDVITGFCTLGEMGKGKRNRLVVPIHVRLVRSGGDQWLLEEFRLDAPNGTYSFSKDRMELPGGPKPQPH